MKRRNIRQKGRFRPRFAWRGRRLSFSVISMACGYLAGCACGVWLAVTSNLPVTIGEWDLSGVASSGDLLSALADCGTYGFGLIAASTSYLGFLLAPLILALKGFFSAGAITVCIRSGGEHAMLAAAAEIVLPGFFLLPALFLLGECGVRRSLRLLALRTSDRPLPPPDSDARQTAMAAVLLLCAAAAKTYVTPAILQWLI